MKKQIEILQKCTNNKTTENKPETNGASVNEEFVDMMSVCLIFINEGITIILEASKLF